MYCAESELPRASNLSQESPWLMFANRNKNKNVVFLSFCYFSFCPLLNILISLPSSVNIKIQLQMRNHFEANEYSFPQKVFSEVCSLFIHQYFKCWSADFFQERKETRSPLKYSQGIPTDRGICWCEEKYAISKILQAFPHYENLLLLMENREEKFQLVHAVIRCLLRSVCQQRTSLQRASVSRRPHVGWEVRFYSDFTQASKKWDLFLRHQWPVATWCPVFIPSGSSCFSTDLKFRLFHF